ncbi:DUF3858 domain-containing protein [Tenacibaculum geojense]|uniref:DUF3858 domain-containing protein n=1 Tax=Tenacibaculum geojense TaxID=915352 RepID=A0ABW3JSK9_9FLAO
MKIAELRSLNLFKKLTIAVFIAFNVCVVNAQREKSTQLGNVSKEELLMEVYPKDSAATALVLLDHGNTYIDEEKDFKFRTDYYKKIKILNKSDLHRATINVKLYKDEKVINVEAITYNLENSTINKTYLIDDKIFEKKTSGKWKTVTFTLPNVKEGSVFEFKYSVISPYSILDDWYFQTDIPSIKSRYTFSILGNWKYNTRIIGFKKLDFSDSKLQKGCLYIPGIGNGTCINVTYEMNDIPAFKEEDYMLSPKNYLSRLTFDLVTYTKLDGTQNHYIKSWKHAEKELKNSFLDGQTSKKNYFKKKLPQELFNINNKLEQAKQTYYHIQNRFNWNNKYWTSDKLKVKRSYDEKKGSVDAINLALYNSLQAVGIESYLVVLSTRDNGHPTKLYPIIKDFNYVIVKAVIDNKNYFLDATDKFLPFGEVPMRCLNGEARVLDFKNGSYWEEVSSRYKTNSRTNIQFLVNDDLQISGKIKNTSKGYFAKNKREKLYAKTKDEILDIIESEHPMIEAEDVMISNLDNNEKQLIEEYTFTVSNDDNDNFLKINPFFYNRVSKNPFKLKERNYAVDFGYPRNTTYMFTLNIPSGYHVVKTPQNKGISLPEKTGKYVVNVNKSENSITVIYKLSINQKVFSSHGYHYLKEFFKNIINSQNQIIELQKIKL